MLSDGSNSFTWKARNQVATLNAISLQYDAFGRRIKNAAGTSFLYNGANAVQQLSGSTVIANLLNGGVDEVFTRTDGLGSFTQLKDALGSTIALADASGTVQTPYTYEPYGGTSVFGAANANEFQYTGRENEGSGLYYYRGRYYNSLLERFTSEDPLGFGGGDDNLYAYVFGDPINLVDPFGTNALPMPSSPGKIASGARLGWQIIRGVGGNIVTLIAEGSGEGVGAGPLGVVASVGIVATGGIIYSGAKAASAEMSANSAYAASDQAVHQWNLLMLARKPFRFSPMPLPVFEPGTARGPRPLAGRKDARGDGGDNDDCHKFWQHARSYCAGLAAMPRKSPEWKKYLNLWGGSYERCVRGQVPQRCGGNLIE